MWFFSRPNNVTKWLDSILLKLKRNCNRASDQHLLSKPLWWYSGGHIAFMIFFSFLARDLFYSNAVTRNECFSNPFKKETDGFFDMHQRPWRDKLFFVRNMFFNPKNQYDFVFHVFNSCFSQRFWNSYGLSNLIYIRKMQWKVSSKKVLI